MNKYIITLFGATGDLAIRKLLPALEGLIRTLNDEEKITIIAVGRRKFNSTDYLDFVGNNDAYKGNINIIRPHIIYAEVDVLDKKSYDKLKTLLTILGQGEEAVTYLYYLAVSSDLFVPIAENLVHHKLFIRGNDKYKIAFEKPFGHSFENAKIINDILEKMFTKNQIYRVDHYLGKEIIQNLLGLRFANQITSMLWNKDSISEVKIVVSEEDGILNRGTYYDNVGVLVDMVQSHLLQILALLTMDAPKSLSSADIQKKKLNVFKRFKYDPSKSMLGQYRGYRDEGGVMKDSLISTLAFLTFYIDRPNFKDVPFYLYTGKKLSHKEAYIEVIFKTPPSSAIFEGGTPNILRIEMYPHSRFNVRLNSRENVYSRTLENIVMDHCFNCEFPSNVKKAYEVLFKEILDGRNDLFASWQEIEASWHVICQIRENKPAYFIYEPGFNLFGDKRNEDL